MPVGVGPAPLTNYHAQSDTSDGHDEYQARLRRGERDDITERAEGFRDPVICVGVGGGSGGCSPSVWLLRSMLVRRASFALRPES